MFKHILGAAALSLAALGSAGAAQYPDKPIRLIVPFPAGQSGDLIGRVFAEQITRRLGQSVVVENRPGAGGTLGTDVAARAPADGYTLVLVSNGPYAIAPALYPKLSYRPGKDLRGVALLGTSPQVFAANPQAGFGDIKQLVALARQKSLTFGSSGNGSTQHLTMEYFEKTADIQLMHVPFRGSADAQTQVLGGQIPMLVDSVPASLAQIKAGRLKAIAVTSLQRSEFLPDVPTVAEQGYPGFESIGWFGLAAPAGTPPEAIDTLNEAVKAALGDAAVRDKLATMAVTPAPRQDPARFDAFLSGEIAKWGKIVKESGATID
ncbi:Bug family tripartite tricarboxylate transporter substrate binding protein [Bordetella bronchialis]|uniref:ABC transporter substrate-binding protein n=1 Tax=Bordetella bronchialis TaxID=463025 RepID=A0ABM6CPX8_9BORD|nr:tripartite tricarboxylate transporter substrate binding protein [Bordetella bronchialis]ANN65956.1 ABC transporter substrate-binding protein [Bordetella bronchialis]